MGTDATGYLLSAAQGRFSVTISGRAGPGRAGFTTGPARRDHLVARLQDALTADVALHRARGGRQHHLARITAYKR